MKIAQKLAIQAKQFSDDCDCDVIEGVIYREFPATREEIAEALRLLKIEPSDSNLQLCDPDSLDEVKAYCAKQYFGER